MLRNVFNFLIFSSVYIAGCAMLMVHQANQLLHLQYEFRPYLLFVFFSTICSYNFHWYLTPEAGSELIRVKWSNKHKQLHLFLVVSSLIGGIWFAFYFIDHWFWLGISVFLTFLYSAPKLPLPFFGILKRIAVGKTIFLTFVWTYVTTVLPIIVSNTQWKTEDTLFVISRFSLIYAICIIFDYRDREQDKRDGIRSMITYLNEKNIDRLFYFSLLLFLTSTILLYFFSFSIAVIIAILIPGCIVLGLYPVAKKNFSDYLYYFILDGLMMLSALFTSFFSF